MAKTFEFSIDEYMARAIIEPIRNKSALIRFVLGAIKIMRLPSSTEGVSNPTGKLLLHMDKMSRLTFVGGAKIFSVSFPFKVQARDGSFTFSSSCIDDIDSVVISSALTLFPADVDHETECVASFADFILDTVSERPGFWGFVRELLTMEDGYVRFDTDPAHENGTLHPLHHLDVFYSNGATFKLGLNRGLDHLDLLDILDTTSACHYLDRVR